MGRASCFGRVFLLCVGSAALPGLRPALADEPTTETEAGEQAANTSAGWAAYEENRALLDNLGLSYGSFARITTPEGVFLWAPFTGEHELAQKLDATAKATREGLVGDPWQGLVAGEYLLAVVSENATDVFKLANKESQGATQSLRRAQRDTSYVGLQPGPTDHGSASATWADVLPVTDNTDDTRLSGSMGPRFYPVSSQEVVMTGLLDHLVRPAIPPRRRRIGDSVEDSVGMKGLGWTGTRQRLVAIRDNCVVTAYMREVDGCYFQATVEPLYGEFPDRWGGREVRPIAAPRPTPAETYLQERVAAATQLAEHCRQAVANGETTVQLVVIGGPAVAQASQGALAALQGNPTAHEAQEAVRQPIHAARIFGLADEYSGYYYRRPLRATVAALEARAPELMRGKVAEWALEAAKADLSFPPTAEQLAYGAHAEAKAGGRGP